MPIDIDQSVSPEESARLAQFAQRALSTLPTVHNSFLLARHCCRSGVPGDMVECGVFAGTQAAAMAYGCIVGGHQEKLVHMFDSFSGIPQAGPEDDKDITALVGVGDGSLRSTGISACSAQQVRGHMSQWNIPGTMLRYREGWFQHTVPRAVDIAQICVLRLDGDLYESTKVCLEHLGPRVAPGGFVIVDDWVLVGCRKAVEEYLSRGASRPEIMPIEGGTGPVFWQV